MDEIDQADLLRFTQHMAWLLEVRIAIAEVLALLGQHPGTMAPIAAKLAEKVDRGVELAEAMAAYPTVFSDRYRATIRISEAEGTLAAAFDLLADEIRAHGRSAAEIPCAGELSERAQQLD